GYGDGYYSTLPIPYPLPSLDPRVIRVGFDMDDHGRSLATTIGRRLKPLDVKTDL
ncbi:hypothetical protein A2U01_0079483, partial [Trifolium medium]|nr:hypothetical protein [Trifolium medium]